ESPAWALAWAMALLTLSTDGSRIAPRLYRYRYHKASQMVSVPAQRADRSRSMLLAQYLTRYKFPCAPVSDPIHCHPDGRTSRRVQAMSAMIFCARCRSELVDVREVRPDGARVIACASCGQTEVVRGFTLGRCG